MIPDPTKPTDQYEPIKKLFSRAAKAHGTDEAALYAELQSLCDTVRKTDPDFPPTPEKLIAALLIRLKDPNMSGETKTKHEKPS